MTATRAPVRSPASTAKNPSKPEVPAVNMLNIHNSNFVLKTPHKCVHCCKEYPRKAYLEGHIRSAHTGERPFVCAHFENGFVLETMSTEHLKTTHGMGRVGKERLPRSKREVVQGQNLGGFNEET
ncbi:Zinc finger protein MSN4 [Folsomia candida]|uniref:Zinc finger protein MSN4 n=1 Tax=Folsomia candida TaxID=158441 RepID=A0A226DBN3_FOLCA|nr:Zinc finger protein MSN4 [Folsomia candida]